MTTLMNSLAPQGFEAPRPGSWALDASHFSRPVTRFHAEIFPSEFKRGFGESFRRYGCLLDHLDAAFINGFFYYCPRPVGAPDDAIGHPPKAVWDELARSHPEIRERLATSATVFERKVWRDDLERFDLEVKPAAIHAHQKLLEVEPRTLSAADLLSYLDRCRQNQKQGCYLHHLYNMPALLPVGDFLVHAAEWTGRPPAELLALMQGSNPDPLGAAEERQRLGSVMRHDSVAQAIVRSDVDPAAVLARLQSRSGEAGAVFSAYVNRIGYRPVNGEDVGDPNVIELPELIVAAMRSTLDDDPRPTEDKRTQVRDSVPARQRAQFDELLDEARLLYRLRDERGIYCDLWAIGIMRRAILAAGERLAREGRIAEPVHLVEADYRELQAFLAGDGPSGEELAERARIRNQASYRDAPAHLGIQPGEPLPPEWLPAASARLERGLGTAVHALFIAPEPRTEARAVRGLGVSPGIYEGTARLVRGPGEFARLRKGDVLVTNSTTTAFNIVLPLLGAIVTDRGGLLSHAAIVAREFGIPAAVGCTDATRTIPDGARVRVDGMTGVALVLG